MRPCTLLNHSSTNLSLPTFERTFLESQIQKYKDLSESYLSQLKAIPSKIDQEAKLEDYEGRLYLMDREIEKLNEILKKKSDSIEFLQKQLEEEREMGRKRGEEGRNKYENFSLQKRRKT